MENTEKTAAALGFFDGVHMGHRAVLRAACDAGIRLGVTPAAFTFEGQPALPKFGGRRDMSLLTRADKRAALLACGAQIIFPSDFDKIRDMSPENFFEDIIIGKMHAVFVSCGEDFRFGKDGAGDAALLRKLCEERGMEYGIVPPVCIDGVPVSSSHIRELIRDGDVYTAAKLLGRHYSFTLPVLHGRRLGRTMGFPTVNQVITDFMVHPKHGVYASLADIPGETREYPAITDIGIKPTVDSDGSEIMETHLIGYEGDLYGKPVTVKLHRFIRPEKKFSGLDELRDQLISDKRYAEELFSGRIGSLS